jgi:hypothetical protein
MIVASTIVLVLGKMKAMKGRRKQPGIPREIGIAASRANPEFPELEIGSRKSKSAHIVGPKNFALTKMELTPEEERAYYMRQAVLPPLPLPPLIRQQGFTALKKKPAKKTMEAGGFFEKPHRKKHYKMSGLGAVHSVREPAHHVRAARAPRARQPYIKPEKIGCKLVGPPGQERAHLVYRDQFDRTYMNVTIHHDDGRKSARKVPVNQAGY